MADGQGIKREFDSLFVTAADDEPAADIEGQESKRQKPCLAVGDDALSNLNINEDGRVLPYETFAKDVRPPLAAYHPAFNETEQQAEIVCKTMVSVVEKLKEQGFQVREIENVCENIKDLLPIRKCFSLKVVLALLGAAGVGKSSWISSILNRLGAAPESGSAQRGTNHVHEFIAARPDQLAAYRVAALYYGSSQIQNLVRKHCGKVFRYIQQKDEYEDETEVEELQSKYDVALTFFRTLLCDLPEFESEGEAAEFFEACQLDSKASIDIVLEKLQNDIENFKRTRELVDNIEYHDAGNVEKLADIFGLISKPPELDEDEEAKPHPCAIVEKLQIHLDNDLLSTGMVLGDTPGVTDNDRAMVDTTTNYIRNADYIFVIAALKRVAANQTLDTNLKECIRLGKMHKVHLIVTMIDEDHKLKPDERAKLSADNLEKVEHAESVVAKLEIEEKQFKQSKKAIQDNPSAYAQPVDELRLLDGSLAEVMARIQLAKAKVKQVAIEIKTGGARNVLKDKLRTLERSRTAPDLPIHFVSNTQYQKHLSGYDIKDPPILDMEGTGIPALRHLLYTLPAQEKFDSLRRVCRSRLPNIFNSIIGVLTKSSLERKQDVQDEITNALSGRACVAESLVFDLEADFNNYVLGLIAHNKPHWEGKADQQLNGWEKFHPGTFAAFCRKSGFWREKKKMPRISWNLKIQDIMSGKLSEGFDNLEENMTNIENIAFSNISKLFGEVQEKLKTSQNFQGVEGMELFCKFIQNTRDHTIKELKTRFQDLRVGIAAIRHSATLCYERLSEEETKSDSSYVTTALQQTYQKCLAVSNANYEDEGKRKKLYRKGGIHPRRVDCLRRKIRGVDNEASVISSVGSLMHAEFKDLVSNWVDNKLTPLLEQACSDILLDFDRRFTVSGDIEMQDNPEALEKLKNAAHEALQFVEGSINQNLERCEEYEKTGGLVK